MELTLLYCLGSLMLYTISMPRCTGGTPVFAGYLYWCSRMVAETWMLSEGSRSFTCCRKEKYFFEVLTVQSQSNCISLGRMGNHPPKARWLASYCLSISSYDGRHRLTNRFASK